MACGQGVSVALVGPAPAPPTVYCTAKLNSQGCTPAISVVGIASASFGNGCTLRTTELLANKPGLYFHSTSGAQAQPFHGGFLCLQAPTKRHIASSSGGTAGTCDGVLSEDLNVYIASGSDPALATGSSAW